MYAQTDTTATDPPASENTDMPDGTSDAITDSDTTILAVPAEAEAPTLILDGLGSRLLTGETELTVIGEVTPGASLSINDLPVAVTEDGGFTASFNLAEGVYQLVFDVRVPNILLRRTVTVQVDTSPPSLRVNTPASLLTTATVMLSGATELDSQLAVLRDGRVVAEYEAVTASAFNLELELIEGLNIFEAVATDEAGNSIGSRFAVVRDSTPPLLELAALPAATRFNTVQLRGTSDPASNVRITTAQGVVSAEVYSDGSFEASLPLVEGGNELRVQAVDSAGNVQEQQLTVVQDTQAPQLTVTTSEATAVTQVASATLSGEVQDNDTSTLVLLINGEPVDLEQTRFSYPVELVEGLNAFLVSVGDAAGNVTQRELTLVRDSTAPRLDIDSPLELASPRARILIHTEEGARVSLDGTPLVVLPGGVVVAEVDLTAAENSFVIASEDAAGNRNEQTVTVTYTP
ncbi:MAG: Ig-like domain-containing protein [Deinococcota bacterium]